jgi:acetylornithine deacetylase/succinyl-diaminopimelate desuccinylase-like protein
MELTVYGPKFPLHSGHYGNWAPNPAMRLAQLLASMKDDDGRVVIDGFYDGIELDAATREVLDSVPDDHAELKRLFGFSQPDKVGDTLQEAIQYPSLNVRGLRSAWVGAEARTIVPDTAIAALDVRLVQETPADVMYEKVARHIRSHGFHIVDQAPDDATRAAYDRIIRVARRGSGTNAFRTELDNPEARRIVDALTEMWDGAPLRIRTMGGTVPISPFIGALGFPALAVPTVNFDNNQHSPNENLRLGHFFDSIVTMAAIMTVR